MHIGIIAEFAVSGMTAWSSLLWWVLGPGISVSDQSAQLDITFNKH